MSWDALNFLRDYQIEHWTYGNNVQEGWVNIRCPNCQDRSNHGGFNPYKGYYHCWRCGGHNIVYIIRLLLGVDKSQAISIKTEYEDSVQLRINKNKKKAKAKSIELPGGKLKKNHRRYLIKRGFDPDFIQDKYGITGTDIYGEWKYRIIIPFYYKNQLITYQGRDITDKQKLRYKTLSVEESVLNFHDYFYNIDRATTNKCCIVEGATDVWRMGDGFIAPFGNVFLDSQIILLSERFETVFIMFDSEKDTQKKAKKLGIRIAAFGLKVEVMDLDNGSDPGDLSETEAKYIRKDLGF